MKQAANTRLLALAATILGASVAIAAAPEKPVFPDWAWPGSATHQQVPPPPGFHRATVTLAAPLGVFDGQADIGGPLIPGSSSFDATSQRYSLTSASYNIWYNRDEFRYVWKKVSGDVSLAADVSFPNAEGYGDRKAVLVIRQDLDDDSREIMTALHGAGLIHLALRPEKNGNLKEALHIETPGKPLAAARIGIEKKGDSFVLYFGLAGEPMHRVGPPVTLKFDAPFYVGIGFCSHVPDTADTAVLSNVIFENVAGAVR
jgi:hypothetical protein